MSIGYLNLVISSVIKLKEIRKCPHLATPLSVLTAFLMTAVCVGYLVIVFACLIKKRDRLNEKKVQDRIGNFYIGIASASDRSWSWLYYPGFLLRRFTFLIIPVIFYNMPCF